MTIPIPKVAAYMTENPHSIGLHEPLEGAYLQMKQHGVRHLPVLSGKRLVGLLAAPNLRTVELLKRASLADVLSANPDVTYDKRIEAERFLEDLTASYQGGWYSVISLHGGGSPAAMKQ